MPTSKSNSTKPRKTILLILDGWGLGKLDKNGKPDKFNAIANAKTPNFDRLLREYPNTSLKSDGESVGLPEGQFGTSEVNHLTIGAGRVIWQDLPRINKAIENKEFFSNEAILSTINHVKDNKSALHLIGILSDGGVHTHIEHVFAILDLLKQIKFTQEVYIHVFTDGRDVAPKSAEKYFARLDKKIKQTGIGQIATIQGRVFLDRDRDWDKTEKAFQLIANGKGNYMTDWQAVMNMAYTQTDTDEYFSQFTLNKEVRLQGKDGIILFHYRTDRIYQLIRRIFDAKLENLSFTSFVSPSEEFTKLKVAFPRQKLDGTLAQAIAGAGKNQLHIAETEKFPHVTYFLNGEKEQEYTGETWQSFTSNRFVKPEYNFEPSMQNFEIAKKIIAAVEEDKNDFIIANFASPDMVGHTGNYHAAVISAESVDHCLGRIYKAIEPKLNDYAILITADHGNSEEMWDYKNNQPHTQHTLNRVPFILVSNLQCKLTRRETLEDIAPTILDLMNIPKPQLMTGESLIVKVK